MLFWTVIGLAAIFYLAGAIFTCAALVSERPPLLSAAMASVWPIGLVYLIARAIFAWTFYPTR